MLDLYEIKILFSKINHKNQNFIKKYSQKYSHKKILHKKIISQKK